MRAMWRWIRRGLGLLALIVVAGTLAMIRFDRRASYVAARWGTPPSQFVEVDGMRVHVRERGAGPALVLVHGSNSALFTWEGWAAELAGKRRVIALDLPGHGLTGPHPQDRYSAKDMAEFLDHVMTALAHPERVDKLILVDAAGLPREEPRPLVLRVAGWPILGPISTLVTPRFVVAASVREVYGDPGKVTDELIDRYYDLLLREGNRRATRIRLSMPDDTAAARRLGELRLPVLILWGARDRWILPKYGERFRDAIPGARLVVFGELGHVPMEEDPVATARAVSAFLDE